MTGRARDLREGVHASVGRGPNRLGEPRCETGNAATGGRGLNQEGPGLVTQLAPQVRRSGFLQTSMMRCTSAARAFIRQLAAQGQRSLAFALAPDAILKMLRS
jgi:hypothetical protein